MPTLPLPRTLGCLVCGRENPHGLQLRLRLDDASGVVSTDFVTRPHHAGFNDVVHGGLIATVADEAMAWASVWTAGRFGLCGELTLRFRRPAIVGTTIRVEAMVDDVRSRRIVTRCRCTDDAGDELATGSAKYVPMTAEQHARVVESLDRDDATEAEAIRLHLNGKPT